MDNNHSRKIVYSLGDELETFIDSLDDVKNSGVDPHQGATGLPPQVPKIVVGVVKDTHLRSAQLIIKFARGAKSRPLQAIL